jgi:hypothetical protein
MLYIGKSKISTLHSKPGVSYPLIRLPQQYKHLIGETAQLFITNHEGKNGFLILLEETENGDKVVKQSLETNVESRLSTLESKIDKLIERNFKNIGLISEQSPKQTQIKAPESGFEPESEPCRGSELIM